MDPGQWLSLVVVCLLGAMSPGPSMAVVVNAALQGGRGAGMAAAAAHGFGVGLYGLLTVTGLAVVVTHSPALFLGLQLLGAVYLLYLGSSGLLAARAPGDSDGGSEQRGRNAAVSGFLVAFLNPKLAVFMLALFAQFLRPDAALPEKLLMAATVWTTDTLWYLTLAMLVSHPALHRRLRERAGLIERCFALALLLLGLAMLYRVLG